MFWMTLCLTVHLAAGVRGSAQQEALRNDRWRLDICSSAGSIQSRQTSVPPQLQSNRSDTWLLQWRSHCELAWLVIIINYWFAVFLSALKPLLSAVWLTGLYHAGLGNQLNKPGWKMKGLRFDQGYIYSLKFSNTFVWQFGLGPVSRC